MGSHHEHTPIVLTMHTGVYFFSNLRAVRSCSYPNLTVDERGNICSGLCRWSWCMNSTLVDAHTERSGPAGDNVGYTSMYHLRRITSKLQLRGSRPAYLYAPAKGSMPLAGFSSTRHALLDCESKGVQCDAKSM